MVEHVSQVVLGFALVGVAGGEVVRGQLEDKSEEDEDFRGEREGTLRDKLDNGMEVVRGLTREKFSISLR
jgi:hypothetical protein